MTAVAERTSSWLAQFTEQEPNAPWIEQLRDAGFARFTELGFPTVREEDWRFTNTAPIAKTVFESAPAVEADVAMLAQFAYGIRLVFVNGHLQESASSLPAGLTLGAPANGARQHIARYARIDTNAFAALNTAFLGDIACVQVAPGTIIEEPIYLVYLTIPGAELIAAHPRALILAGENSQCTVVETFSGSGAYLNNSVTEIVVGAGASVDHYKVQQESLSAFHIATLQAELGRASRYSTTSISLGGALVRNNSGARLAEGSEATLNGLYLVKGAQHADNQLAVDHAEPNASSHELYKGVLDGKSTAAFNGKILVRKDAQKTDARQTNKNLLLSDDAVINTKPELQVLADDVRCTHGATIGQLDAEAAFYLRSRGIDQEQARNMLTIAFAQDVIDRIKIPALRNSLEQAIFGKLYASR